MLDDGLHGGLQETREEGRLCVGALGFFVVPSDPEPRASQWTCGFFSTDVSFMACSLMHQYFCVPGPGSFDFLQSDQGGNLLHIPRGHLIAIAHGPGKFWSRLWMIQLPQTWIWLSNVFYAAILTVALRHVVLIYYFSSVFIFFCFFQVAHLWVIDGHVRKVLITLVVLLLENWLQTCLELTLAKRWLGTGLGLQERCWCCGSYMFLHILQCFCSIISGSLGRKYNMGWSCHS